MASNTKLSADEKVILDVLRKIQPDVLVVNDEKTTIAYRQFKTTVEFSTSVSSDNEKKFRAKVGEFHARNRFHYGESVKMDITDFYTMLSGVFGIFE